MEELNLNLKNEFRAKGYLICDKIGEGGCSCIYKAQQINTGIFVAIKILKLSHSYSKLTNFELITCFKQSNALYDFLQHSSIVICFGQGELNNSIPYAIFEYISGETLKQFLIARTEITSIVLAGIMRQVLEALAYAHSMLIVHGDLKPQNIMIFGSDKELQVKLIDFGVSKSLAGFKSSDLAFLSPRYNAPEQLKGNSPTLLSDLYSWALIFLECLTGAPVILGNSIEEIACNHLNGEEHVIPEEICKHPLGKLLAPALNKEANRRELSTQYLLEEFMKLDFNTLPNCLLDNQQIYRQNTDNTILVTLK
ncbi:MAG: serine/threonine-protein kinase [Labilibaculum antarcticum]